MRKLMDVNPDGLVVRFRLWLSKKLNVQPEAGSFWCVRCSLYDGKTLVQYIEAADEIRVHAELHQPKERLIIKTSMPSTHTKELRDLI